jgi:hypothetical protein
MSSAARVKKHRERRQADGRRRYEFVLTPREADGVRAFIARERQAAELRWPARPATPEEIALDPRLALEWPNGTWADYIAFAQAGVSPDDPDDPIIERDRTPDRAYEIDWD